MDRTLFEIYLRAARFMDSDYREGYQLGLRRRYQRDDVRFDENSEKWRTVEGNPGRLGQGYRDGFGGKAPNDAYV